MKCLRAGTGYRPERCDLIRTASPMHDIGKIGTPDHVLLKPGKFTPEEFKVITQHTEIGFWEFWPAPTRNC
ncbi:MAG: hypothetical protein MRJ92_04655 [Nitrospira sp.]|nr:hypothetical protein [Nitrospira sp.]